MRRRALTRRIALLVCMAVLVGCAAIALVAYALHPGPMQQDFFGVWSWARFVIERPPARIYDHAEQHALLLSLNPPFTAPFPFSYPPPYLLLIRPLGSLSYPAALHLWTAATFLAYWAVVCRLTEGRAAALLAILAPAAGINVVFGQNGFLTAALLVGGAGLLRSRPILAGILLGLLSYKPQFGLVIGVALVAAGCGERCSLARSRLLHWWRRASLLSAWSPGSRGSGPCRSSWPSSTGSGGIWLTSFRRRAPMPWRSGRRSRLRL